MQTCGDSESMTVRFRESQTQTHADADNTTMWDAQTQSHRDKLWWQNIRTPTVWEPQTQTHAVTNGSAVWEVQTQTHADTNGIAVWEVQTQTHADRLQSQRWQCSASATDQVHVEADSTALRELQTNINTTLTHTHYAAAAACLALTPGAAAAGRCPRNECCPLMHCGVACLHTPPNNPVGTYQTLAENLNCILFLFLHYPFTPKYFFISVEWGHQ